MVFKRLIRVIISFALAAVIAFGGRWYIRHGEVSALKDTEDWAQMSLSGYTVRLPRKMSRQEINLTDPDFKLLDCFSNNTVGFAAAVCDLDDQQAAGLKKYSLIEIMDMTSATRNGQKLVPVERGDKVYVTYRQNGLGPDKDTDVYVVDGLIVGNKKLYEILVFCPSDDSDEYKEYLLKILDSFKLS